VKTCGLDQQESVYRGFECSCVESVTGRKKAKKRASSVFTGGP
jgi:hypothetical protein